MTDIHMTLKQVNEFTCDLLTSCGAADENAVSVANSIELAESDGIRNIGLGYLPVYLEHLKCGKVDGKAVPKLHETGAGTCHIDAGTGFAHPAIDLGTPLLIEKAKANGISAMGIGNSYACGVLGHLVEPLAKNGLLAMGFANAPAIIAPWGGKKPLYGTNPMAIAIPSKSFHPVIIDQASSKVAKVAIFDRQRAGQKLDEGWALDKNGNPTTDPEEALQGSMLAIGGYKGAGLAMFVEVMAAALTGSNWSFKASLFNDNLGGPPKTGQFFIALDPCRFGSDDFLSHIEGLFSAVLAQQGTQLPSEERYASRKRARKDGILLDRALYDQLMAYK